MNKKYTRIAKLILALAFLWALGLPDIMVTVFNSNNGERLTIEQERESHIRLESKIDSATKMGKYYTAENYFIDLVEIRNQKLDQIPFGTTYTTQLQSLAMSNSSIDEAIIARDRHIYEIDPISKEREEAFKNINDQGGVWEWVQKSYFWLLPWVLILFIIWRYENCHDKKNVFKSPLSFILCVVGYPIFFAILIFQTWMQAQREVRAEVDIRRTKSKLFSILSEDEVASIKRFAKSKISLKQFQQEKSKGKVLYHYGFTSMLIVTLLLSCFPIRIFATESIILEKSTIHISQGDNVKEVIVDSLKDGPINIKQFHYNACMFVNPPLLDGCTILRFRETSVKCLKGWLLEVMHVPLLVNLTLC